MLFFWPVLGISFGLLITPTLQNALLPRSPPPVPPKGTPVVCQNKFVWNSPQRLCTDKNQQEWTCVPSSCYILTEKKEQLYLNPKRSNLYFYHCEEPYVGNLIDSIRTRSYEIVGEVQDVSITDGFIGKQHVPKNFDIHYSCSTQDSKNFRRVGCNTCYKKH
ncbi:hypothetical protein O181_030568 [Austropuccinia psidii MF-1]|uniref:Uncharacterized protein n=1 Tax=Austropuccinia psidii MF-1 TaxID=1389203 RepID=A0A9Q3H3T7_9BASI|nr:hypothetical protein [Austropuccinia psidii MF-1]